VLRRGLPERPWLLGNARSARFEEHRSVYAVHARGPRQIPGDETVLHRRAEPLQVASFQGHYVVRTGHSRCADGTHRELARSAPGHIGEVAIATATAGQAVSFDRQNDLGLGRCRLVPVEPWEEPVPRPRSWRPPQARR